MSDRHTHRRSEEARWWGRVECYEDLRLGGGGDGGADEGGGGGDEIEAVR